MGDQDAGLRAGENWERLRANPYPGRGIVLGRSEDGKSLFQLYWIMGRSANSRNRVFVAEDETLRTAPHDPAKVEDPSLVIYTAMARQGEWHVVSNGDHTDTIIQALAAGGEGTHALRTRAYEPDAPNNTPRIAGAVASPGTAAWLAILKADPTGPGRSLRQFFEFETLPAGLGWCLTTYEGDGDPLPSYSGEPMLLPLSGSGEVLLAEYWNGLHSGNRVALALKTIDSMSGAASLRIVNALGDPSP